MPKGNLKGTPHRPVAQLRKMGFHPLAGAYALEVESALEAEATVGTLAALGVEAWGFVRSDGSGKGMVLVP